jgi:endonuclease/exonuclease/phosphatase family metal-dependent hydrolase
MPELRLLTYNVKSLTYDGEAVAAVVRHLRPDVVAVQEAPRKLRWRSKRAALARRCGLVVATADGPAGLFIMTSLAASVESTSFTLLPKAPDLHQRAVCRADVTLRGARWRIASVHFSLDDAERLRHVESVWAALGDPESSPPLVVAGDLNEAPGGPVWQALTARLRDAYAIAPAGPEETFSALKPRWRIDAVLVDPAIQVVECRTVDAVGAIEGYPDGDALVRATDHRPVLATLRQ